MEIKLYDKVLLASGKTAHIVEIWESGIAYEADIADGDGEYTTDTIKQSDIVKILSVQQGITA